ncbi:MAG: hypothetical protein AAB653_01095, partial [Patescibacteria group bacterium]
KNKTHVHVVEKIFKQTQYAPVSIAHQVLIFFAVTVGLLDDIQPDKIIEFETSLYKYADINAPKVLQEIVVKKELTEKLEKEITSLVNGYKEIIIQNS